MIQFRQKNFGLSNIANSAFTGAHVGFTIGGALAGTAAIARRRNTDSKDKYGDGLGLKLTGYGTLIGATLGLLVGTAKEIDHTICKKTTVDRRLMSKVVEILKKTGYKEGEQFTRDSKVASSRKIKVCITISKESGEVRVGVNTISDPKLKGVLESKIRTYQNASIENVKMSDKFNDITISAVSDGSADAGFIASIADTYIHAGYPVYLVEVG